MMCQPESRTGRCCFSRWALGATSIGLLVSLTVSGAYAQEPAMPSVDDVWLYAPMEGTLQSAIDKNVYQADFRQWTLDAITTNLHPPPDFVDGLAGKALFINAPSANHTGDTLAYLLDVRTFPIAAGTFTIWYRPTRPLDKELTWLYGMGWATFQAVLNGGNFEVQATSSNQDLVRGNLQQFADGWANAWHLMAVTWEGPCVRAYVDGVKVGEGLNTTPLKGVSTVLDLGSLPPGPRKAPLCYAAAAYDDVAIFSKSLTEPQMAKLFAAGRTPGYRGLLNVLGQGALIQTKRQAFLRGEKVAIEVSPFGEATAAKLMVRGLGADIPLGDISPKTLSTTALDTRRLRPGTYALRVDFYEGAVRTASSADTRLVIREEVQPEFPLGLGAEFGSSEETLALYEKMHISLLSGNGPSDTYFRKQLDNAFSHGLALFPNFNILEVWGGGEWSALKKPPYFYLDSNGVLAVSSEWNWKFLQTLVFADGSPDDHSMSSSASPFSPIAFDMMSQRIRQIMAAAGDYPGLWAVSFQDEVPLRMGPDKATQKMKVGDYSYYAVEHFKKVTGLDKPAFPPQDPEGTVWPDNHPYLLWAKTIGLPGNDFTSIGFEDLYVRLGKEVKKARPKVLATNYSGGEYGHNDSVLDWNYPTIWGPEPWGSGAGSGYLDYVFDRHWSLQDARPRKPLWALLGWWSGNMASQEVWCVADFRLNTEWALAKGAKELMWFNIGRGPFDTLESGLFSKPELRAEMERWCDFIHEKGAVFSQLEKRPTQQTAVLWSEVNRAGHVLKTADKAEYYLVFAGLRNIGANPDVVTDTMIREGALKDYEALVLCGFDYSCTSLWQKITAFAATPGKKVYCDDTSKLVPPGAISLGAKWYDSLAPAGEKKHDVLVRSEAVGRWANHLRPIVAPKAGGADLEITDDPSGQVGPHLLWAGATPYLFVINTDMEQARSATVRFRHGGTVAYDLMSGQKTELKPEDGRIALKTTLPPGGWAAFVLPAADVGALTLAAVWKDGAIVTDVAVIGVDKKPVAAAWPLRIELLDPDGKPTSYEKYTSTGAGGTWQGQFSLGSLTDPKGRWTIRVTELLTGKTGTITVPVVW